MQCQMAAFDGSVHCCRQKCEVLVDDNRQLRKDLQEQETEMFKVSQRPSPHCHPAQDNGSVRFLYNFAGCAEAQGQCGRWDQIAQRSRIDQIIVQ